MKVKFKSIAGLIVVVSLSILFSSYLTHPAPFKFPYAKAGLTDRQAAAHLLGRLTYGATPEDIDKAVKMGLENWLELQLAAKQPDESLAKMLHSYDAINLSNAEVLNRYPKGNQVLRMAQSEGFISKDSVVTNKKAYREKLQLYMKQKGFLPQQELFRQFINQKILRAAYTENQLQEILTDFWFNHFNVSLNKNQCAEFVPAYERDVIRPNALGDFETLLIATAKSPAMLFYLDNFSSMAPSNEESQPAMQAPLRPAVQGSLPKRPAMQRLQQRKKSQGLNENYAREVMELHTLGVDGGYTQQDVTQAARVLTGWTIYPMSGYGAGAAMKNLVNRLGEDNLKKRGFVRDGDFMFAANRHDNGEKVVLGKKFPAGRGYEEGVELLKMLSSHPSTARFISRKIAVRFVSDNPPQSLVNKMARTFQENGGNIKQVIITMVSSPEFWSTEALRQKTKSPFELAISAVRSLNAEIKQPYQLYQWVSKMGQKLYYYQAPTGFPDNGQYWINTGSLLNRMNFGLALSAEKIPGIKVDLARLNSNKEPESADAALRVYSELIMPERELDATLKRLTPMLKDPAISEKIEQAAAAKATVSGEMNTLTNEDAVIEDNVKPAPMSKAASNMMLAQVVGVIIGSPEFQRK